LKQAQQAEQAQQAQQQQQAQSITTNKLIMKKNLN